MSFLPLFTRNECEAYSYPSTLLLLLHLLICIAKGLCLCLLTSPSYYVQIGHVFLPAMSEVYSFPSTFPLLICIAKVLCFGLLASYMFRLGILPAMNVRCILTPLPFFLFFFLS